MMLPWSRSKTGDSAAETLTETDTTLTSCGHANNDGLGPAAMLVTSSVTGVVSSGTTTGLGSDNAALLAMLTSTANVLDGTETDRQLDLGFQFRQRSV